MKQAAWVAALVPSLWWCKRKLEENEWGFSNGYKSKRVYDLPEEDGGERYPQRELIPCVLPLHMAESDRESPTLRHKAWKGVVDHILTIAERPKPALIPNTFTASDVSTTMVTQIKTQLISPYSACEMEDTFSRSMISNQKQWSGKQGQR